MPQQRIRRPGPLVFLMVLALCAGTGAIGLIEYPVYGIQPISISEPIALFEARYAGLPNTGFSIRSIDGSALTFEGESRFDPTIGLQAGETVQEGFVLLDGTLSLSVAAFRLTEDNIRTRARTRTTYRLNFRRDEARLDNIARALYQRGIVRDLARARARASGVRLEDARVMRLIEDRDGGARWVRAVRALRSPERARFRPRTEPTGVLGHFGTANSATGESFVWAVLDRNSRYAVGVTVDRDGDGVPNVSDNCVGTENSNQSDADGDQAGDSCDVDDDNDAVLDGSDNCALAANADQRDTDADGSGDACDFDDDNDGVLDGADRCLATAAGSIVDALGCSIADTCPCASEWRNHGAYQKCVSQTSERFLSLGLITGAQKDAIVSAAAGSSCGK